MSSWVRLWHDMPTDPKWRVIARRSGASLSEVIAVFTFVMVNASANANERGRTHNLFADDIAAALDMDDTIVEAILAAMEGKVLSKGVLMGWEKRQPKREDNSADRARQWREEQKAERKRTQANADERPDTDAETDTEVEEAKASSPPLPPKPKSKPKVIPPFVKPDWVPAEPWAAYIEMRKAKKSPPTDHAMKLVVDTLDGLRRAGDDPGAVLNQSTKNNWTDVYKLKEQFDDRRGKDNRNGSQGDARARDNRDGFQRALDRRILGGDDASGRPLLEGNDRDS